MQTEGTDKTVLAGRYRLDSKVGVGGMSVVYRATDLQEMRTVGIKMLKEEFADDEDFLNHFRNEVQATKNIRHPNIVEIYELGQEGNIPFIVMEYIDGITLKAYINAVQSIGWRDALNITAQILSAVDCAHSHGVVHRDIKPQNILITEEGRVKLSDFGIAHAVTEGTRKAGGDSAGSVHYLSPEQARGGFVDERSDLYSIGITMYEMVTGVVPFDGDSHVTIALKHIDGNIVPPHTVDPDIPYGVSDLIMMATKKDPAERFQTARDMYARLKMVSANPNYSFLTPENNVDDGASDIQNLEQTEFSTPLVIKREAEPAVQEQAPETHRYTDQELEINRAEIVRSVTLTTFAYVLAIVLGIAGILFMVSRFRNLDSNMNKFTEVKYEVEDYTAMNAEAVVQKLTAKGIKVVQEPVSSDEYPTGYVVSQSVKGGETVSSRGEITLFVASAANSFTLEDWTGKDYREAGAALSALGLNVSYQATASSQFKVQLVVRTIPAAGSIVAPGETVTLRYSTGALSQTVRVPNLIGLTEEQAAQSLTLLGLNVGRVYPSPGSDITDLVATPTPTEEPSPSGASATGSPLPQATGTVTAVPEDTEGPGEETAGPTQTAVPTAVPSPSPSPSPSPTPEPVIASLTVVAQYPAAGTEVSVGESVELYFYNVQTLADRVELELKYPSDLVTGLGNMNVRIESRAITESSGFANVIFSSGTVQVSDFPIRYTVSCPANGVPVKVVIYINGAVYRQILVTREGE